jgi:hypothetical protein
MITIATIALLLILLGSIVHWVAAVPVIRAISNNIDCWADSVGGIER